MRKGYRILLAGLGVVLVTIAGMEHIYRRIIEHRYHRAVDSHRQLSKEFQQFRLDHDQVKQDLTGEQTRNQELSRALAQKSAELEQSLADLGQERRNIQQLHSRLESMNEQIGQLQGELSLALQRTDGQESESGAIHLERVLIGTGPEPAGSSGRVVSVHGEWRFVVISLGWNAVRIGDTISIFRDDQLLAKAKVERVQEGVSAATILPEWDDARIEINDLVRVL